MESSGPEVDSTRKAIPGDLSGLATAVGLDGVQYAVPKTDTGAERLFRCSLRLLDPRGIAFAESLGQAQRERGVQILVQMDVTFEVIVELRGLSLTDPGLTQYSPKHIRYQVLTADRECRRDLMGLVFANKCKCGLAEVPGGQGNGAGAGN